MNEMRKLIETIEAIERGEVLEEGVKDWLKAGIAALAISGSPVMAGEVADSLNGFAQELRSPQVASMEMFEIQGAVQSELDDMDLPSDIKNLLSAAVSRASSPEELAGWLEKIAVKADENLLPYDDFAAEVDKRIAKVKADVQSGKMSQDDGMDMYRSLKKTRDRYADPE